MFIADIAAAATSAFALVYTLIYVNFILGLPAKIADTSLPASERNAKLIVLVTMAVVILIILVKVVISVGKLLCKRGYFPDMYARSMTKRYRIIALFASCATTFYVFAIFMLVYPYKFDPGRTYTSRRVRDADEALSRVWEMNWFIPMLSLFLILFIVFLLINVVRLKMVLIKDEYDELSALKASRSITYVKCKACGFDNHKSSTKCAECEAEMGAKGLAAKFDKPEVVEALGNIKL